MPRRDRWAALGFLLLGAYVVSVGRSLSTGTLQRPGPGLQPFILGVLFLVLGAVYLLPAFTQKPPPSASVTAAKRPLLAAAAVLFYWAALTRLGFALTTLTFLAYWLIVIERRRWGPAALVSLCTTAGLYAVFTLILRIRLPLGLLF